MVWSNGMVGPEGPYHCSAKGPKIIDVLPSLFKNWLDADIGSAGQLAESILSHVEGLKQGPLVDESVRPVAVWKASGVAKKGRLESLC